MEGTSPQTSTTIEDLRKKYSRIAEERDATLEAAMAGSELAARVAFEANADHGSNGSKARAPKTSGKLESLRICPSCSGLGVTSSIYNHIVKSSTCQGCGGDGVVSVPALSEVCSVVAATEAPSDTADGPPPLE